MINIENMPDAPKLFLIRQKGKIRRGEYNKYLTIPFASHALLFAIMCEEVERRINENINPLLSEAEILDCIEETKTMAVITASIFKNKGILAKKEEGLELTELGKKCISTSILE